MSESNLHAKSPAKLDPVTLMTNKLTRTELKEYKEAFEMLDSDEDGFLSTADIIMAIRGVGYNPNSVIRELLEDMSRESPDGVAKVDFEEFVRLVCLNVRYSYTAEDARADFEDVDIDKDGYITATELKDYLKNMKIPFGDEEIDEMVEEADTNHDGKIDYEEFIFLMRIK